ncbi:MAG: helix-turn-helix domain-containing protein [Paludibacter sp.]|jgi:AraC-like DNA-binding protein|nr:helix-turn-helix domain-containing protein [Paludibacter sp.]
MKNKYTISVIIAILFAFSSVSAQNDFQQTKDSLLKVISQSDGTTKTDAYLALNSLLNYYETSIDTLIKYFDALETETRKQGNIELEGMARANSLLMFRARNHYEDLLKRANEDLVFLEKNNLWALYYRTFSFVIDSYLYSGKSENALSEAKKLYEKAQNRKDNQGLAIALFQMGMIYLHLERYADAEKCLEEAVLLENQSETITDLRLNIYFYLSEAYSFLQKYDKAQLLLQKWEPELIQYEEIRGRGKLRIFWSNLYKQYLQLYLNKKEYDKIEPYCKLLDELLVENDETILMTSWFRSCALMAQKQYQKAYQQSELCYETALRVGNEQTATSAMGNSVKLLAYLGRPEEAAALFDKVFAEKDSLYNQRNNAQLDELRTVYEVDKITAEKEKTRNYLIFSIIGCILLAIALGIWIYLNRQIARKNRSLYLQIQELLQKEKAAEQQLFATPEEELSRAMQLFRQLSEVMQKEKLFINTDMNRKTLSDRLGTNESYLADAIREATGDTFSNYVSDLRLQYTLELMSEDPNLTLDAVAIDSGHGSYSAFLRLFTKKYGITPSEYRKMAVERKN